MANYSNSQIEQATAEWVRVYGSRKDGYDLKNVLYASYYSQQTVGAVIRGNAGFSYLNKEIPTWLMIYGDTYIAVEDPTVNDKPGLFVSTVKPALTNILIGAGKEHGVDLTGVLSQGGTPGTTGTIPAGNNTTGTPYNNQKAENNTGLLAILAGAAYYFMK